MVEFILMAWRAEKYLAMGLPRILALRIRVVLTCTSTTKFGKHDECVIPTIVRSFVLLTTRLAPCLVEHTITCIPLVFGTGPEVSDFPVFRPAPPDIGVMSELVGLLQHGGCRFGPQ